jgi:hypothetical protein
MFAVAPPVLAHDFRSHIVAAHRERGAAVAGLLRNVARWMVLASR